MNETGGFNVRRLVISGVVLLLLSAVLLIWARDIIREAIVIPLSYLIYAGGILVDTTPQICFWMGIIILCLWIAYRSMRQKRRVATDQTPAAAYEMVYETPLPSAQTGRMEFWARKVSMMRRGPSDYYQNSFETALGRLLLEVLAYRYRLSPVDVEACLRDDTLDVPSDVRNYLLRNLHTTVITQQTLFGWLRAALTESVMNWMDALRSRWFPGRVSHTDTPAEQRAQRILAYIEEELEVPHDSI